MTEQKNETKDHEQRARLQGWRRYLYTEGGFVLIFGLMVVAWYWYEELLKGNANYDGFLYRKLKFLEPALGEHYVPIFLSILVIVVAVEVWRQGRK